MNKYTIQFNIAGKGFNKIKDDKFMHNFFNWLDNWGGNYFEEIDDTEEEKYVQAWEDVEFKTMSNELFTVFNQGMEELTPLWKITNINPSIHWDLWEEITDEIANNSDWYFMNVTGFNMTVDLIEDGKDLENRFELGEYIQNKALTNRY